MATTPGTARLSPTRPSVAGAPAVRRSVSPSDTFSLPSDLDVSLGWPREVQHRCWPLLRHRQPSPVPRCAASLPLA